MSKSQNTASRTCLDPHKLRCLRIALVNMTDVELEHRVNAAVDRLMDDLGAATCVQIGSATFSPEASKAFLHEERESDGTNPLPPTNGEQAKASLAEIQINGQKIKGIVVDLFRMATANPVQDARAVLEALQDVLEAVEHSHPELVTEIEDAGIRIARIHDHLAKPDFATAFPRKRRRSPGRRVSPNPPEAAHA